jgi:hypothetical protein
MTYVKKSLDLSSRGSLHGNALREYLEVAWVIPLLHLRKRNRAIVHQSHPNQAVTLLNWKYLEAQSRRDRAARMSGNTSTSAFPVVS